MKKIDLLAFFGHHRGATQWIRGISSQICNAIGLNFAYVHNPKMFSFDLKEFITRERVDFLAYVNSDFKYVENLQNFKGFHVVRDPRDVAVSSYFSHLHSHPTDKWPQLAEHRIKLEKLPKDDGLMLDMEFIRNVFEMMYNWDYFLPNIQEIKLEELTHNPYKKFLEIFQFLGILNDDRLRLRDRLFYSVAMFANRMHRKSRGYIPYCVPINKIPAEMLLGIVYENDFSKKASGRKPGEEDVKSHYRKGVAGDWENHFNEEHKRFFKDNFNDLLIKLGYESDGNW